MQEAQSFKCIVTSQASLTTTNTTKDMKNSHLIIYLAVIAFTLSVLISNADCVKKKKPKKQALTPLQKLTYYMTPTQNSSGCVSFNPYVKGYDEYKGPHPPKALINLLMDKLVNQTNFKCIQIYKLHHNLPHIIEAAKLRNIKVLQIIWLEPPPTDNKPIIKKVIGLAKKYKDTIIGLSCGSEFRLRNSKETAQQEVLNCLSMVKKAKVKQPVTSNELVTTYCNMVTPCIPWVEVTDKLDYLAFNSFPWWSNHWSGCVPASAAKDVHLGEYELMKQNFPNKTIVITEWGWPAGPKNYRLVNKWSGKKCDGVASEANQNLVVGQSLKLFIEHKIPANMFSFSREPWKGPVEDIAAAYWGICSSVPPYNCKNPKKLMENAQL